MSENAVAFAKRLNERGLDYEEWCAGFLTAHGYAVQFDRTHEVWDADLVIAPDIKIEVKGGALRKLSHGKPGYGFLLYKAGHSHKIVEPVVALVCHNPDENRNHYFFVPTCQLQGRHYLEFRNPEPWKAARGLLQFYQSFDALDALGAARRETEEQMQGHQLRKTVYGERDEHFFQGERRTEPELPWRKWIRENLPRGPEGFVFEDIDGVAVLFDPQKHVNQKFMLVEFKYWNIKLDRSQVETLRMIDELLWDGDTHKPRLYRGVYVVEWHREDEFARINYTQILPHHRLREFFLFNLNIPSYFEK